MGGYGQSRADPEANLRCLMMVTVCYSTGDRTKGSHGLTLLHVDSGCIVDLFNSSSYDYHLARREDENSHPDRK
jgi:hypothetical protein